MKKLFILIFFFLICSSCTAQNNNWESISYLYSKGPVSPEYQLNYNIIITRNGDGKLVLTRAGSTNENDFTVGKKGMKKLNRALKKSEVFTVSPDQMKADQNTIGGPTRSMSITMWQQPNLDQMPTVIEVPGHLKDPYDMNMFNVYEVIENLVPESVWNKATGR